MYCIRHVGSNFLRRFKPLYLHKLVVNTSISTRCYGSIDSYSKTEQEYNKNYQRLKERGRPKSTRYLNEMDSHEMRGPRWCTICGHKGHSCNRCPQRVGPNCARGH
ncbi:hypothetical protein Ahy_A02g009362 [Arachis hypogaea]|uniref:CCHC-type domain-containing protein n=1 Tax=Arachis hypogaea TaxID=3818 RepID=A0A445EGS8_ARAHY|nr:hypothetical protein Ahy_A02g009362 [Arachis hypogaea]